MVCCTGRRGRGSFSFRDFELGFEVQSSDGISARGAFGGRNEETRCGSTVRTSPLASTQSLLPFTPRLCLSGSASSTLPSFSAGNKPELTLPPSPLSLPSSFPSQVHAALPSNTMAIYGTGQVKELTELVPGILNQLGPDSLASLRKLAESYQQISSNQQRVGGGAEKAALEEEDDDDVPDLVESFEEVDEKKEENKLDELSEFMPSILSAFVGVGGRQAAS